MTTKTLPLCLLVALAVLSGCGGSTEPSDPDGGTGPGPTDTSDAGDGGDGGDPQPDPDPEPDPVVPTNLGNPDNATLDSDCDGLTDAFEFATVYTGDKKTHPGMRDTDGDGIRDGVELGRTSSPVASCSASGAFVADADPTTTTNPTVKDSDGDGCLDGEEDTNRNGRRDGSESDPFGPDCSPSSGNPDTDADGLPDAVDDAPGDADADDDGLFDGVEDTNRNGRLDSGETDPARPDSDCDGLRDGAEDANQNGRRDAGETDPRLADTDGDGLVDGLEKGVTDAQKHDPTLCPLYRGDTDTGVTTDPTDADSDDDGISDGAEDANKNGKVDSGELDPRASGDGTGPAAEACRADRLRPVTVRTANAPDLQLALPSTFAEADVQELRVGGTVRGLMGYDATNQVAFIAWREPRRATASNPTQDEAALRPVINGVATLTPGTTQTFTTWDGYPALGADYEQEGGVDLKARANALLGALLPGASTFSGSAGATGPFHLQAQYVHRSNQSVVVLLALTPTSRYVGQSLFTMKDTAGGSALAQFADTSTVQCETFSPSRPLVDFLFVVDDSGSMASSQTSLSDAATAVAAKLGSAFLDWRIAMVTTSYPTSGEPNTGILRPFTTNIDQFRAWLKQNSACVSGTCSELLNVTQAPVCSGATDCWVGTGGAGAEKPLEAAKQAVDLLSSAGGTPTTRLRPGARLVVVLLTDTRDQSTGTPQSFTDYFLDQGTAGNPANQRISVHGIICPPDGARCHADEDNTAPRHLDVITATGGVSGSIQDNASITDTIHAIVDSVIASVGHTMSKPPIGASVKVALAQVKDPGSCPVNNDLPRSTTHGFDFDGQARTVSFFGGCQPAAGAQAAVSYRAWSDQTPEADRSACAADCGGACGTFEACNTDTCACQCVESASCAPGFTFKNTLGQCGCFCDTAALNCGANYQPDAASCSCRCDTSRASSCPQGTVWHDSLCACIEQIG